MGSECAILGTEIGGDRESGSHGCLVCFCNGNGFLDDIMSSYAQGIPTVS